MSKRFAPGVNRMPSCPRGSKTTPLEMGGIPVFRQLSNCLSCAKSWSGCLSRRIHLARQGALLPGGVVLGESGKKKERSKALLRTQFEGRGFHSNRASPSPGTGGGCYLSDSSTRTP